MHGQILFSYKDVEKFIFQKGEKCMKKVMKVLSKILIGLLLGLLLCGILYFLLIRHFKPIESTPVSGSTVETINKDKFGSAMPGDEEPAEEEKKEQQPVKPVIRKDLDALRVPALNVSPSSGDEVDTTNQEKINSKDTVENK